MSFSDNHALHSPVAEPLFVFGSLIDADVMTAVIGQESAERIEMEPAELQGFRRRRARDEVFPILVPHPEERGYESVVSGALVHGLTPRDLDRILFYEGDGYALRRISVHALSTDEQSQDKRRRRCEARVFLSTGLLDDSGEPWSLEIWQQRTDKQLALMMIEELMALYGVVSIAEIEGEAWEEMKARCRERLAAGEPAAVSAFRR